MLPPWLDRTQRGVLLLTVFLFSAGYATLGLVAVLGSVVAEGIATRRLWQRSGFDGLLLAFVVAFLIAGLASAYRTVAIGSLVLAAITVFLGFGPLYRALRRDRGFLIPFLTAWFGGGVVAAGWAIGLHLLTGSPSFTPALVRDSVATTLLIALVLGLWLLVETHGWRRYAISAGSLLILVGLITTYARGAWLIALAGILCFVLSMGLRRTRRALAPLLVAGAVAIIAVAHELPGLTARAETLLDSSSYVSRVYLAQTAGKIFADHPLVGTGLSTFSYAYQEYYVPGYRHPKVAAHAHNVFVNMAAEGGALGFAAFLAIVVVALVAGQRWRRRAADSEEFVVSTAVLWAFVTMMLHEQIDSTIVSVHLGTGFWFFIAVFAASTSRAPETAAGARAGASILIISNGHGEDAVGNALAHALQPASAITAFPLVGPGAAYTGVDLLEPRRAFPSGGFGLRGSWRGLWADLNSGAVGYWMAQRATLRQQRGRHRLVVAVGDVYCLRMAALAGTPIVFIATAKSEYNEPHRALERRILRRHASVIFTRDQVTADALRGAGLPARYAGNPLMDTIGITGALLRPNGATPTITILPGSRADAYSNLRPLLRLCEQVGGHTQLNFLCPLAPGIDREQVKTVAAETGWLLDDDVLRRNSIAVTLTRAFGDAVQAADVVVGLAGTANEQAAGLGKPVVTFAGSGAQITPQFVRLQKRLLGEALIAAQNWEDAADAVVRLLQDSAERAARGDAGRQRMGEPGAVKKIARAILDLLRDAT